MRFLFEKKAIGERGNKRQRSALLALASTLRADLVYTQSLPKSLNTEYVAWFSSLYVREYDIPRAVWVCDERAAAVLGPWATKANLPFRRFSLPLAPHIDCDEMVERYSPSKDDVLWFNKYLGPRRPDSEAPKAMRRERGWYSKWIRTRLRSGIFIGDIDGILTL